MAFGGLVVSLFQALKQLFRDIVPIRNFKGPEVMLNLERSSINR